MQLFTLNVHALGKTQLLFGVFLSYYVGVNMSEMSNNLTSLRNALSCPLSYDLFQDPVTEEGGTCCHTFERVWIQESLSHKKECPLSRAPLTLHQLVPNQDVKNACALLNPDRAEPLTAEDYEEIQEAIKQVGNRTPVSEDTHEYLKRKVCQHVEMSEKKSIEISETLYSSFKRIGSWFVFSNQ